MPILRITRTGSEVEAALEGNGVRHIDRRPFSFALSAQDAEDIRWYLEDYRIYPVDPQPKTASKDTGAYGRNRTRVVWRGARGRRFGAGIVRYNTATVLGSHNRWSEANLFAEAAVRDFENSDNAEEKIVATLKLLEWIESRRQASSPPT